MKVLVSLDHELLSHARSTGRLTNYYNSWHLWRDFRKAVEGHYKIEFYKEDNYHSLALVDADETTANFVRILFPLGDCLNFEIVN